MSEGKTIKDATKEFYESTLFKYIKNQIGEEKAYDLASWLVHYAMITSTLIAAKDITLDHALLILHGEKLSLITKALSTVHKKLSKSNDEKWDRYIW